MKRLKIGVFFIYCLVSASIVQADNQGRITTHAECQQWVRDSWRGRIMSAEDKARNMRLNCGKNEQDFLNRILPSFTYE